MRSAARQLGSGPSPRTWGELKVGVESAGDFRTIPTHVGRTEGHTRDEESTTDHPHARGENRNRTGSVCREFGPSPRTWGEHHAEFRMSVRQRTIPTHVGRTSGRNAPRPPMSDHPHARGENPHSLPALRHARGPSPRTWGEPHSTVRLSNTQRTIPTHVGRTSRQASHGALKTDHPHARGENFERGAGRASSSDHPHARGEND